MKVSIIGLGYVGLPLACAISKLTDAEVFGYDLNQHKIDTIKQGKCPIDDDQCATDLQTVRFEMSNDPSRMKGSEIYCVCVPTPVLNDYSPDLIPVKTAVETVAKYIEKGQTVVIESTINPGVCDEVVVPIIEEKTGMKAGEDFDVAHCPERINPGDPKWNVYNIPRNIGSTSREATKKVADFYRKFISGEINEMPDLKTTEATKIIENTFRDINIAFVNELAKSFDVLGIDLVTVIKGASNKPFAFMPHFPSCGVGGHCIPVDPYYLIERAKQSGFDHKYLKLAREINNSMPAYTIELLTDALNNLGKPIKNSKIALLGLSYKANVGDLRESPSIKIRTLLEDKGADLRVYDPYFPDFSTHNDLESTLSDSIALVICTDHDEFKDLTYDKLNQFGIKAVIDGKNCLDKTNFINKNIYYKGIGR